MDAALRRVQASYFDCRSFELAVLITEQSMKHGSDTLTSTRSKTSIDSRRAEAMVIGAIARQPLQHKPPVGRTLPTVKQCDALHIKIAGVAMVTGR